MGLNKQKGNMYEFVTHTWNTIKGECYHNCNYCYVKRWGALPKIRFDEKELKTDLGKDNFIFVGSSNDMFAHSIPVEWIGKTLDYCKGFDNKYLFQSKNPIKFTHYRFPIKTVLGATIESNRDYPEISDAPEVKERARWLGLLSRSGYETMVTIEPILDFDLDEFVRMLKDINPTWINIGADSGGHGLPEPSPEKIKALIEALPNVKIKKNLKRLKV